VLPSGELPRSRDHCETSAADYPTETNNLGPQFVVSATPRSSAGRTVPKSWNTVRSRISPSLQQPSPNVALRAADASPRAAVKLAGLSTLAQRITAGRPPEAWSLAALFLFKGLTCVAAVAFPISSAEPTTLVGVVGALALVAALGIWLLARRISMIGFELLAAMGALVTSDLVAHARTHGGMMLVAFAYPWIAIYAAHFFSRRVVSAFGLLISVGFGAGLLISGLSHVAIYWAIVTATIWSICILLGNLSERLRHEVNTDHLTGLLNRSGFTAAALRERALANRTSTPLTVAAIDLDEFKQVNDRCGHAAGDRLLATLARDWRERLRPSDILARHGGDEFVLLLPCTSQTEAEAAVARLRGDEDPVGWSIGISQWLPGEELDAVLTRADERLYEAKLAKPTISVDRMADANHLRMPLRAMRSS